MRYVAAIRAEELAEGTMRQVVLEGHPIAICRVEGAFYAVSDVCTHEDYYLTCGRLDGYGIECPVHASVFDIRSGEAEFPPAERPLRTYPCRVIDGMVEIALTD